MQITYIDHFNARQQPIFTALQPRIRLLGQIVWVHCDCGATALIHKLPYRCIDCGEWQYEVTG